MAWISPRSIKWNPSSPRNIWYFRKELQRYTKKKPPEINYNASLWKWLYNWFDYLYRYRKDQQSYIPRAFEGMTPPQHGTRISSSNFSAYVQRYSLHIFGLKLVPIYAQNCILPIKHTKGVRDGNNNIVYYTEPTFHKQVEIADIRWCSVNKDWYLSTCFFTVLTYKNGELTSHQCANPSIFRCPSCGNNYLDAPENKVKNHFLKITVCPKCKDKTPKNNPHTEQTIFGDYHSHYRTGWKFFPCSIVGDETIPMGVELEMQTKNFKGFNAREQAWNLYQHQLTANDQWNYFYCERDGSIGEFGMELITQPMTQRLHQQFWYHMLPAIRENFSGWNTEKLHPGGQYGIHITFDSKLFGQLNLARLGQFIEKVDNKIFIQGIAQRSVIYGSSQAIGATTKKTSQVFQYQRGKLLGSAARNQAINLKSEKGLCEIRMFNSTLNTTSFFKNLEFLWAFRQWAGETPWSTLAINFTDWLYTNPKLYSTYPHLYEYLCHKKFPVKRPQWDVDNALAEPFTKLVDSMKKGQKDLFEPFSPETSDYTP